jgi:hypothetical protein
MRHIVNFGLLFAFVTLAASGIMAFWLPFSIVTTRVHVVFGTATALLVALHLASRLPYFRSQLVPGGRAKISKIALLAIIGVWGLLLAAAIDGWPPAEAVVAQGYEAQNRATIVRASPLVGFGEAIDSRRLVARVPGDGADTKLSLFISFDETIPEPPTIAVWAESSTGSMIETLYIDPRVAYAEEPTWGGEKTPRVEILPIWRHRYTLVSGIDPHGEIDALTQPTPTHTFTLDDYLRLGDGKEFVLCVEVNVPGDSNESYPDAKLGQPSLLYTAYIELDSTQPYSLLELTGHGAGSEKNGAIQYDLDHITTAKQIVDLLLAKTELAR